MLCTDIIYLRRRLQVKTFAIFLMKVSRFWLHCFLYSFWSHIYRVTFISMKLGFINLYLNTYRRWIFYPLLWCRSNQRKSPQFSTTILSIIADFSNVLVEVFIFSLSFLFFSYIFAKLPLSYPTVVFLIVRWSNHDTYLAFHRHSFSFYKIRWNGNRHYLTNLVSSDLRVMLRFQTHICYFGNLSDFCLEHYFEWKKKDTLHNSKWTAIPTQTCISNILCFDG